MLFLRSLNKLKIEIESKIEQYFAYFNVKWAGELFVSPYLIEPLSAQVKKFFGITLEDVSKNEPLNEVDKYFKEMLEQNPYVSKIYAFGELERIVESYTAYILLGENYILKSAGEILDTFKTRSIEVSDGAIVNYYIGGNGSKVILIMNAFGQSIHYWRMLIYHLVTDYKIIIWEPRGAHWKDGGLTKYSPIERHVDDIEEVLITENIEKCYFLGWCTAPKVALQYYLKHSHRVKSLLFISGSFKGIPELKSFETNYEKNLEEISKLLEKQPGSESIFQKSILSSLNKKTNIERKIDTDKCDDLHQDQFIEVFTSARTDVKTLIGGPFQELEKITPYFKQLSDFWLRDVKEIIHSAEIPLLFISGDCDQMASSRSSELLASISSQAVFVEVKRGNHFILTEQSDLIRSIIHNFIENSTEKIESSFIKIRDFREGKC
ncbi:alpha/beta fold hydrolase [Paenibacillus illinoisensis]|uniref:alpha/beta fold hydrolase n=1 Tax=Paenibacillus illinoisensis TaxID=59845 RepID=UPI00383B0B70